MTRFAPVQEPLVTLDVSSQASGFRFTPGGLLCLLLFLTPAAAQPPQSSEGQTPIVKIDPRAEDHGFDERLSGECTGVRDER